ncbi:hypothetical protein FA13DRAFT_1730135 [Coprinellus micaceus]|uniref:Uncharacterized protein n=1 Tax=Coprinellus micaceus TaxID=71717 RepID=A0A4Y7TI50_COPMI|nr:hypothetical protein FA13DRAFT_1730135 [Coprinellus micaceus]
MGQGGAGKSTFTNALLAGHSLRKMNIGHSGSLQACTIAVDHEILDAARVRSVRERDAKVDYRLVLVDTPGFNSLDKNDSSVLNDIATWSNILPEGGCRGGIVFLHNLESNECIRDSDLIALETRLQTVIATTKWRYCGSEGDTYHNARVRGWRAASVKAQVHEFRDPKKGDDAWGIVNDLLAQIEGRDNVDFHGTFSALKARQQKKEKKRRSLWGKFLALWK